jgi:hypothetical protein
MRAAIETYNHPSGMKIGQMLIGDWLHAYYGLRLYDRSAQSVTQRTTKDESIHIACRSPARQSGLAFETPDSFNKLDASRLHRRK